MSAVTSTAATPALELMSPTEIITTFDGGMGMLCGQADLVSIQVMKCACRGGWAEELPHQCPAVHTLDNRMDYLQLLEHTEHLYHDRLNGRLPESAIRCWELQ